MTTPREPPLNLRAASQTLTTLADRWSAGPSENGEGAPAAIERLRRELAALADAHTVAAERLAAAMARAGETAAGLGHPPLAELLGERHRIVAHDWQAAALNGLVARLVRRALDLLASLELAPEGVRAEQGPARVLPAYLYSASELLERAADVAAESAALVHESTRRWGTFVQRMAELAAEIAAAPPRVAGGL